MDHMMPVMDGVQTLHAIRALEGNPSRDIPVKYSSHGRNEFFMVILNASQTVLILLLKIAERFLRWKEIRPEIFR